MTFTKHNKAVFVFFLRLGRGGAGEGGAGPPPHLLPGKLRALSVGASRIVTFWCRRSGRAKIVRPGRLRLRLRAAYGQFTGSLRASYGQLTGEPFEGLKYGAPSRIIISRVAPWRVPRNELRRYGVRSGRHEVGATLSASRKEDCPG